MTGNDTKMGKASLIAILLILFSPILAISRSVAFGADLPQASWRLWYVDSEETVGENTVVENAFDGVSGTIWHTQWYGSSPPPPHEIQIDLGGNYTIEGFRYLPRQDGSFNGGIANYAFYVSADGTNWGTAVATGTFPKTSTEKEVLFAGKPGRFIRLRALSEVNGKAWTSIAELNVLGSAVSGNQAPNGVIDTPSQNQTINAGGSVTFTGTGSDPDSNFPLGYRWSFGSGSGIPDSTLKDPGAITFSNPGTFTVTFVVTDALGLSDPTPATRVITVSGGTGGGGVIPQASWRLWYVDSEETVGENTVVENAFDGVSGTIWHTQWYGSSPPPPHEIQIDLGGNYTIEGFRYLPRQDGSFNGGIANYAFYVSADGTNWGTAVATGTFPKTSTEKEVLFAGKPGRFIRLRALSEVNGKAWTSIAELNVLERDIALVDQYVAIGDSITRGVGDDYPADDRSLDGRNIGGGYEPVLNDLLTALKGFPHSVVNEGVGGVTSAYGAANISSTLSKYPSAKYYLVQYGTNDANIDYLVPSGRGLIKGNPGYNGSYKDNMQQIISAILGAGKTPCLAKVPYSSRPQSSDPAIREYNDVINELVTANGISVTPPDFYSHFKTHPGELADGVHPNGAGYQSMANLWFNAVP